MSSYQSFKEENYNEIHAASRAEAARQANNWFAANANIKKIKNYPVTTLNDGKNRFMDGWGNPFVDLKVNYLTDKLTYSMVIFNGDRTVFEWNNFDLIGEMKAEAEQDKSYYSVEKVAKRKEIARLNAAKAEKLALKAKAKKEAAEKEKSERQKAACDAAHKIATTLPVNHSKFSPYIIKKGIADYVDGFSMARYDSQSKKLYIPAYGFDSKIQMYQFIFGNGNRIYQGSSKGAYTQITPPNKKFIDSDIVGITEGFATAISVATGKSMPVACAFDSGNLLPAIQSVINLFHLNNKPLPKFALFADNDKWDKNQDTPSLRNPEKNTGVNVVDKVAQWLLQQDIECYVYIPEFPQELDNHKLTDFNDMHVHMGIDAVNAVLPAIPLLKPVEIATPPPIRQHDQVQKKPAQTAKKTANKKLISNLYKELGNLYEPIGCDVAAIEQDMIAKHSALGLDIDTIKWCCRGKCKEIRKNTYNHAHMPIDAKIICRYNSVITTKNKDNQVLNVVVKNTFTQCEGAAYGDPRGVFAFVGCGLAESFYSDVILVCTDYSTAVQLHKLYSVPVMVVFGDFNLIERTKYRINNERSIRAYRTLFNFKKNAIVEENKGIAARNREMTIGQGEQQKTTLKTMPLMVFCGKQDTESQYIINYAAFLNYSNTATIKTDDKGNILKESVPIHDHVSDDGQEYLNVYGEIHNPNKFAEKIYQFNLDKKRYEFERFCKSHKGEFIEVCSSKLSDGLAEKGIILKELEGITLINSGMGTGKTYTALDSVDDDKKTVLVAHLRGLVSALHSSLNSKLTDANSPCAHYETLKPDIFQTTDKIAICLDSLGKLVNEENGTKEVDLFIVDEITQLVRALAHRDDIGKAVDSVRSKQDGNNILDAERVRIGQYLAYFFISVKRILLLDAHITPEFLKIFDYDIFKDVKINIVLNTYNPDAVDKKIINMLRTIDDKPDDGLAVRKIDSLLKAGNDQNVFVALNSKAKSKAIFVTLNNEVKTTKSVIKLPRNMGGGVALLVNQDTTDSKEVKAFLADINGESKKYRCIIASPSVSTGISIDKIADGLPAFKNVVGHFASNINRPNDALQALNRVRGNPDIYVYIEGGRGGVTTSFDEFNDQQNAWEECIDNERGKVNTGDIKLAFNSKLGRDEAVNPVEQDDKQWITDFKVRDKRAESVDHAYFYHKFIIAALEEGYAFSENPDFKGISFKKKVGDIARRKINNAVLNADFSGWDKVTEAKGKVFYTPYKDLQTIENNYNKKLVHVLRTYKPRDLDELKYWIDADRNGKESAKLRLYEAVTESGEVKYTKKQLKTMDIKPEKIKFLQKVLQAVGWDKDTNTWDLDVRYNRDSPEIVKLIKEANNKKSGALLRKAFCKTKPVISASTEYTIKDISRLLNSMGVASDSDVISVDGIKLRVFTINSDSISLMKYLVKLKNDTKATPLVLDYLTGIKADLHDCRDIKPMSNDIKGDWCIDFKTAFAKNGDLIVGQATALDINTGTHIKIDDGKTALIYDRLLSNGEREKQVIELVEIEGKNGFEAVGVFRVGLRKFGKICVDFSSEKSEKKITLFFRDEKPFILFKNS